MKKYMHVISHSHWDREWYMGFEQHRVRLVELMDALIDKMENDPEYKYFHLDGQMIIIEDYLEIRPEQKDRLYKLIREGRIQVGPCYILQDEFLVSGEASIRNLLEGMQICRENGFAPLMSGYFPDAFGNIAQLPQILQGFGIDNAIFGRGMGVIFEDNKPADTKSDMRKELKWYSSDGSFVIGVMFSDWYNNAMELPVEREAAQRVYGDLIYRTSRNAGTPHLLAMNGTDHQPLQLDLLESMQVARELFGEQVEIKHSNFKEYLEAIRPYVDDFPGIYGEITGQQTSGEMRLVDTGTTHMPLKQYNHKTQNMLQQQTEPISVMADLAGDPYRTHLLRYAWKTLMKNHAHDSICTCSCDTVAREMAVRFEKAYQVAEYVRDEAAEYLAKRLNTENGTQQNIVVFHTSPKCTEGEVTAILRLEEYADPQSLSVTDWQDRPVGCSVRYLGKKFSFTLPKDATRRAYRLHTYEVRMQVALQGMGCFAYKICHKGPKPLDNDLKRIENGAENRFLKFKICADGTLDVWDKVANRSFSGLHRFEDSGDCGEGYNYCQTKDGISVYPSGEAKCQLVEQTPYSITYQVTTYMDIPVGLTEEKGRTAETIRHELRSRFTLRADSRRIEVETTFVNQSENHRLRVLFPSNIQTKTVMADGQFDVLEREITPWEGWKNPSYTQRMQAFFGLEDAGGGLLIAGRGLNNQEVLRDGKNTMAVDLLRAVGEVGDWGDFPAPMMQVKGEHTLRYAVIPYAPEEKNQAFESAYGFAEDRFSAVQTGRHTGEIAPNQPVLTVEGDFITCTAVKKAEDGDGYILRMCNVSGQDRQLRITMPEGEIYETNMAEDLCMETNNQTQDIPVAPKKIKTYRLRIGK